MEAKNKRSELLILSAAVLFPRRSFKLRRLHPFLLLVLLAYAPWHETVTYAIDGVGRFYPILLRCHASGWINVLAVFIYLGTLIPILVDSYRVRRPSSLEGFVAVWPLFVLLNVRWVDAPAVVALENGWLWGILLLCILRRSDIRDSLDLLASYGLPIFLVSYTAALGVPFLFRAHHPHLFDPYGLIYRYVGWSHGPTVLAFSGLALGVWGILALCNSSMTSKAQLLALGAIALSLIGVNLTVLRIGILFLSWMLAWALIFCVLLKRRLTAAVLAILFCASVASLFSSNFLMKSEGKRLFEKPSEIPIAVVQKQVIPTPSSAPVKTTNVPVKSMNTPVKITNAPVKTATTPVKPPEEVVVHKVPAPVPQNKPVQAAAVKEPAPPLVVAAKSPVVAPATRTPFFRNFQIVWWNVLSASVAKIANYVRSGNYYKLDEVVLTNGRIHLVILLLNQMGHHKLFGLGAGGGDRFLLKIDYPIKTIHNDFLRIYVDYGCIGLLLFLFIYGSIIRRLFFTPESVLLIGIGILMLTDNVLIYPTFAYGPMLLAILLFGRAHENPPRP